MIQKYVLYTFFSPNLSELFRARPAAIPSVVGTSKLAFACPCAFLSRGRLSTSDVLILYIHTHARQRGPFYHPLGQVDLRI